MAGVKIAIIGGKNSGKTIFLNTIAYKIHVCDDLKCVFGEHFSDIVKMVSFAEDVITSLQGGVWPKENNKYDELALVELEFKKRKWGMFSSRKQCVSFLDYPGEAFNVMAKEEGVDNDILRTVSDLKKSRGYILLMSVDEVDKMLSPDAKVQREGVEYINYYTSVLRHLIKSKNNRIDSTDKPCLVVFCKSDKITSFSDNDFYKDGDEVRSYARRTCGGFYAQLTAFFEQENIYWAFHSNIREQPLNSGTKPDFKYLENVQDEIYLNSISKLICSVLDLKKNVSFFDNVCHQGKLFFGME